MTFAALLQNLLVPLQWWVVVAPWERGIRARCGKNARVLGPGLHFKIPFIDRVSVVSVRTRMISDSGQTMRTLDGKPLTVNIAIQFSIVDVLKLYETIANPETTLVLKAQAAVGKAIASMTLEEVSATKISDATVNAIPADKWGLGDVDVQVTSLVSARTFKLMMHDYRSTSGLDQSLSADDDRRVRA